MFLCSSQADVKTAFETINGKVNGLGSVNEGALVQEFLDGTEYVIDTVSRDGVHKVIAIWEYDKRCVQSYGAKGFLDSPGYVIDCQTMTALYTTRHSQQRWTS